MSPTIHIPSTSGAYLKASNVPVACKHATAIEGGQCVRLIIFSTSVLRFYWNIDAAQAFGAVNSGTDGAQEGRT
jgi:hypothetical protein